jgi:hypothetical protein
MAHAITACTRSGRGRLTEGVALTFSDESRGRRRSSAPLTPHRDVHGRRMRMLEHGEVGEWTVAFRWKELHRITTVCGETGPHSRCACLAVSGEEMEVDKEAE